LLVTACVVIAGMGAMAKTLGAQLPAVQIAFLRFALALPLVVIANGRTAGLLLVPPRIGLHLLRGAAAGAALAMAFYAYAHLRLGDATALLFLEPLFVVAIAAVAGRRHLRRSQWAAVGLALVGACVILRPGMGAISVAGLVATMSAAAAAAVALLTRRLAAPHVSATLLFHGALMPAGVLLLPACWVWVSPTSLDWMLIAALALAGTGGQWLIIAAYRRAPPAVLAPIEYVQLPAAMLLGLAFFDEPITAISLIGVGLIVGAPFLIRPEVPAGSARRVEELNP
jgi:drug/metabolite transporter (DMT)-like permease